MSTTRPIKALDDAVLSHHFISIAISASGKSNQEIAEECGFLRGNVVAMIRSGAMKLPINRVLRLAKAVDVDPITLLRKTMSNQDAVLLKAIEEILGAHAISEKEFALIQFVRAKSGNLDIEWTSRPEFVAGIEPAIVEIRKREGKEAVRQVKTLHEGDNRYAAVSKKA